MKEKDTFELTSDEGKNWVDAVKKNKKAMMQFALSFTKVAQLNKLNCAGRTNKDAGRTNKDWPSGKAHHEVMTQLIK